tara:strand:+ start:1152 stop:1466 length:315 start_codon:yes stop_codon:yes gene_type:complete
MIYGIDIDGTICTTNCEYKDAKPYNEVIKKINLLYDEGHKIIFFTSRGYKSGIDWYDFTKKQIDTWGVKYHELKMGKPQFDLFIDDKAVSNTQWYRDNNLEVDI